MGWLAFGACLGFSVGTVFGAAWATRRLRFSLLIVEPIEPPKDPGRQMFDEITEHLETARMAEWSEHNHTSGGA